MSQSNIIITDHQELKHIISVFDMNFDLDEFNEDSSNMFDVVTELSY